MKPLKPEEFTAVPGAVAPYIGEYLTGMEPLLPPPPTPVEADVEVGLPK